MSSSNDAAALASASNMIGLTKAAFDLINSSNPVNKLAVNLVKWLARECINEDDFNFCVETCRGIAYPNAIGLEIRESILKSQSKALRAGGIQLVVSGTIGRWMAFTQDHAYMVTTVAVITAFHHPDFATELLCEMAMDALAKTLGPSMNHVSYSVDRARLSSVLVKFVDSIYSNVIAAGHTLGILPQALQEYCVHLVDARIFSRIAITIANSSTDLMLLSDFFHGDLLLWILHHFEGGVKVSVAGKEVYFRKPLVLQTCLTMVVKKLCDTKVSCKSDQQIEILEFISETWKHSYHGQPKLFKQPESSHRRELYTLKLPGLSMLEASRILKADILAINIVKWMLEQPVERFELHDLTTESFFPKSDVYIGDILAQFPKLINQAQRHAVVGFAKKTAEHYEHSFDPEPRPMGDVTDLCRIFPKLDLLISDVWKDCKCPCRQRESDWWTEGGIIDMGSSSCRVTITYSHILMLVADAIADGFGAHDVAGIYDASYLNGIHLILNDLLSGRVVFSRWFSVAAFVVLGIPWSDGVMVEQRTRQKSLEIGSLVAIQHASLVVAARWFDMSSKYGIHGCFALEVSQGCIPGLEQEIAFVFSEPTMDVQYDIGKATCLQDLASNGVLSASVLNLDTSEPKIRHAIVGTSHPISARLITFLDVKGSQRIVDPARALVGNLEVTHLPSDQNPCQKHRTTHLDIDRPSIEKFSTFLWTFSDLLSNWTKTSSLSNRRRATVDTEGRLTFRKRYIDVSNCLDTDLKVNVALAVSPKECLLVSSRCCVQCLFEKLEADPKDTDRIIVYEPQQDSLVQIRN